MRRNLEVSSVDWAPEGKALTPVLWKPFDVFARGLVGQAGEMATQAVPNWNHVVAGLRGLKRLRAVSPDAPWSHSEASREDGSHSLGGEGPVDGRGTRARP